ncbi:MAG: hypothetical protein IJ306_01235 [Oscillospiraceae bacterium]|nr:hypothetical protein [Oscillospiraceae bacterium]
MKTRTAFLKRYLALALAVILALSNVTPGMVIKAHAAEDSVNAGEVIANNYELTEAEKNLLKSGYLAGDYKIVVPAVDNSWVAVDPDAKKITATGKDGWVASAAEILVGEESVETVTLTDGEGTYAYDGNAFSVKVNYVLEKDVNNQEAMLGAMANLKAGVANLAAAYEADTNLGTVVMAMDTLVDLANGITMDFGSFSMTAQLGAEAIAAVRALDAQVSANTDKLDMQVKNADYTASTSKTQYLVENGAAYKATLTDTYNYLNAIKNDPLTNNDLLDSYLQGAEPAGYTQWMAFKNILSNLVATLEPVANAEWNTENLVSESVNYANLDALVAALGELTVVEVKNPLTVAETSVHANLNMKDVTVTVVLNVVEDAVDSANLVEYASKTEVITLEEGASAEKIIAESRYIVESALAAWADEYVEGKFKATVSELPATLTEDIAYTITYSPVNFAVTGAIEKTVPYGYKLTLPKHPSAEQAYDYTVNGIAHSQGEVVTIIEDTVITRSSGKSYTSTDLYTVVANNFGDDIAKAILTSGALKDNSVISYRKPDPADAESLLKLENGELTAVEAYDAAYESLEWFPYVYGLEGNMSNYFNGEYTKTWIDSSVKVQYILALTNFGQKRAQEVLDLAAQLKSEAAEQKSAMDSLAGMESTLAQLDKTKLGALNGVIDVTDFTEGDETDTDEENLAIRAELKSIVSQIIANNVDSNNYLKIYNMVVNYNAEGLKYYYENYAAIKAEVELLASYMTDLMDNEEALKIMCTAAGYPEYAEKISDVETQLNDYNAKLSAPNAAIDVESENLGKLVTALTAEGETSCIATGSPYILSEVLTATDSSQVLVQVMVETPNGNATVTTKAMDRGTVLTQEVVDDLKAKVEAKVAELLGGNEAYYNLTVEGEDLDALVGTELTAKVNVYHFYSYKEYTVVIEGEEDQIVTINDLEINLPKHTEDNWVYRYTIDGVEEITTSTYTFTVEQLDRLFVNGSYTITRVAVNEANEKLEETFEEWLVKDEEGNVTGLYADVDGNKDGIVGFAMTIVNSGYTYIGLNGEPFLYLNAEDTLEIKLQTLINALLNDNEFSNETLINLGKNGKGEFVHASMQLGNSADDIHFEDLDFTLYLNSVPSQMVTVANGLEKIESYLTFNSNNGVMAVKATLPEKVYEVYLAALLATDNVEKDNMEAINSEIAFQFLWDYVEIIMATDANTVTYTNTLAKLGIDKDLTGAEEYYQLVKKALTNEGVVVNPEDDNDLVDLSVTAKSQKAINGVINFLGIDVSAYETYMGMIYEYKYDYAEVYGAATVELTNTGKNFEAALLDIRHPVDSKVDYLKKFDFTDNLPERAKSIAGEAVIILLGDVEGDLVFNDATILDLNGYTVNGNIVANGKTLIFDSSLDTYNCGSVTGTVSGSATIVGGNYTSDVTALLPDGYEVENNTVRNILYTISENGGNVTFAADADIINKDVASYTEAAAAIAADMVVDLVLNYFTSASLEADGYSIYNVTVSDIIGLYDSTNRKEALINTALDFVSLAELNGFINNVIDKMLDFAAIEKAIDADEEILTFDVTVAPWYVSVDHITEGDYITFGVEPNAEKETSFTVGLKMDGSEGKKEYAANLVGGLSDIVDTADAEVEILKPTYSDKELTVSGTGSLTVIVDVTKDNNTANDTAYSYKEYVNVLAVVFANGVTDSAKADALVAAIGDDDAMKAAIDALTVKDVFDALKNMSVANTFANMVAKLGITADLGNAAELEAIYHLIANAAGEGLEKLDITGSATRTLGSLWNEETGYYEWSTTRSAERSITRKGYTLTVGATIEELTIKVRLFGDEEHVHNPGEEVIENEVPATCETEGSYDKVVYCTECGEELSRETVTVPALGHTAGEEVIENNYPATCDTEGSYDKVVYCTVCGEELSRETVTVPALGHVATPAVVENEVPATCETEGSYDKVVYCGVCGKELSRETVTVPALGHTAGEEVIENEVAATCETEGSYDKVVYCTVCGKEISRETVKVPALGHDYQYEIVKEPGCEEEGLRKITCSRCDYEKTEAIEPLGHKWGPWVVIKPATETSMGLKQRCCEVCHECETQVIPMIPGREDEENPGTGAFVAAGSAIIALATIVGTAIVTEKKKRR